MGNPFKSATIVLSIALVFAVAFGSFSMFQNNSDLKDAQAQIGGLNGDLSGVEGLLADLNQQIDTLSSQLAALDKQTDDIVKGASAKSDAIARMLPSVVFIEAAYEGANGQVSTGSGSGVIMDKEGYILTNKHVVTGSFAARVITSDRRIYEVDDIWEDDITDLAVVKITAQNLVAATFGDPAAMKLGDTVIAIGYPLGMSPADGGANASSGIISNLGRFFWIEDIPYYDLMEIDAAINPGNSGGALVNLKGELVGINSAGTDTAQGINYAISVATAKHVYEDLVEHGQGGHHPFLGLIVDDNIEKIPGELFASVINGAEVTFLDPTGPATKAGIKEGDVVMKFNGQTIGSASDFIRTLWRLDVGDKATLLIKRGGLELIVEIIMPIRPAGTEFI